MTPGWSIWVPMSCSRLKRSNMTGSLSISGCGTLMATCWPVSRSVARKTVDMPLVATMLSSR